MTRILHLIMSVLCFLMSHSLYAQGWNAAPSSEPSEEVQKFFYGSNLSHQVFIQLKYAADGHITGVVGSDEYTDLAQTIPFTARQNGQSLQVHFSEDPPAVGKGSDWLLEKAWSIESHNGQEMLHVPMMARNYETMTWEETTFEYPSMEETSLSITPTPQMTEQAQGRAPYRLSSAALYSSDGIDTHALFIDSLNKQRKGVVLKRNSPIQVEAMIGHHLVLSLGNGMVRELEVLDLALLNSTALMHVTLQDEISVDANQAGFSFYNYSNDMPIVTWNAATMAWESDTVVPERLLNKDFEHAVAQLPERWSGMRLAALQKVHVNLSTLEIDFLDEYQWRYIE